MNRNYCFAKAFHSLPKLRIANSPFFSPFLRSYGRFLRHLRRLRQKHFVGYVWKEVNTVKVTFREVTYPWLLKQGYKKKDEDAKM